MTRLSQDALSLAVTVLILLAWAYPDIAAWIGG